MSLVIASQLDPDFNSNLARHPSAPHIIGVPEDEPWSVAGEADVLLVRPSPSWRTPGARATRPPAWPGRLQWVYSASVGIDFYPDWLLDAPLVTCGRGVAAEEIADYVIAAIYAHAKPLDSVTMHARADFVQKPLGRVSGTTIGIIGFGAIGAAVARRGIALGAQVVAVRRSGAQAGVACVQLLPDVESVVEQADHLLLAVPATPATRHLVNDALLAPRPARRASHQCRARLGRGPGGACARARCGPARLRDARRHRSRAAARGPSALQSSQGPADTAYLQQLHAGPPPPAR